MTMSNTNKIAEARAETAAGLEKALSYTRDLQKPAQIDFYRAHLAYLDKLASGVPCEAPKVDRENWDVTQTVLDARAGNRVATLRAIFDEDRQGLQRWRRSHTEALFTLISSLQQQVSDEQKERHRVEAIHADAIQKWRMGGNPEALSEATGATFNAAINFALDDAGPGGLTFLRLWREGDWEALRREFPEFDAPVMDATVVPGTETAGLAR